MASIFLSYARADAATAKALARALDRAGHDVWWDRHIAGGTEYAGEIQRALDAAEVVIVLWSQASIGSEWVRDEAAEGRDSGRLRPVTLDNSKAPLGFRQRQSIDLAKWNGRGRPPTLDALLAAISGISGDPKPAANQTLAPYRPTRPRRLKFAAAAITLLALLLFGAWRFGNRSPSAAEQPTVVVLPFADLSPQHDKAYFAEGVAESVLSLLGREPGIRVIGRSSSSLLKNQLTDLARMRETLGVTHVVEGSARTAGQRLRLSVRLIRASDGTQLWAEDYERNINNVFAVQDEIGKAVARRLVGSLSPGRSAASQVTRADAYNFYLAARAQARDRSEPSLRKALALTRRVIAADPRYAPGHALLAELIWQLSDFRYTYGSIPFERARPIAIASARRAIALAPRAAEGYAALGLVSLPEDGVAPLKRAIALDPSRSELRLWLALHYADLGQNQSALREVLAANAIDPLWANAVNLLTFTLGASGQFAQAEGIIQQYLARGGKPAQAARFRTLLARHSGDLSRAVEQGRLSLRGEPNAPFVKSYLEGVAIALNLPSAVTWEPEKNRLYSWTLARGDRTRMLAEARADGANVWTRPDALIAVRAFAEARDWKQLEMLYDSRRLSSSATCTEHLGAAAAMIIALNQAGRKEDAARLLQCTTKQLAVQARGPVRAPLLPLSDLHFAQAQLAALEGHREAALSLLSQAVNDGWRGYAFSAKLASYPALDGLRSSPDYGLIQQGLDRIINAERRETVT